MESMRTNNVTFARQILRLSLRFNAFWRHRILWVGDSHAMFMRKGLRQQLGNHESIASLLYWIGPRLMFSVSKSGFPSARFFRLFVAVWKPRVLVISLGEIDIRMFLSDPSRRSAIWVEEYLRKVSEFCDELKINNVHLLTSIPISDLPQQDQIQSVGTVSERLNGFSWLQSELTVLVAREEFRSKIYVLNLQNCLSDKIGKLDSKFTDDGIHVNARGAWEVWNTVSKQIYK